MAEKNEDKLENKLDDIFKNINDWLKFAEQKNAALIVLNGSIIWGVARVFPDIHDSNIPLLFLSITFIGYVFIGLSMLKCVLSFLPVLRPKFPEKSNNCLYFADIAKNEYSSLNYLQLVEKKLQTKKNNFSDFEKDLSSQIIINSNIALNKYEEFESAAKMTIWGMIIFSIMFSIITLCIYFMDK